MLRRGIINCTEISVATSSDFKARSVTCRNTMYKCTQYNVEIY